MNDITAVDEQRAMAMSQRPDYLPAATAESNINKINQRISSLPILSTDNDEWTLVENREVIHKFDKDEIKAFVLFVYFDTQRRVFEDEYDETSPQDAMCQSNDNVKPMSDSPEPQSETCDTCWRNEKGTKRRDKCSHLRNSIVLIQYLQGDQKVTTLARLRLNGGTLYGEEDRPAGELNGESFIREMKRLEGELWYHPVTLWFDTDSPNARNKVMFEVMYDVYPTQEQADHIKELERQHNYQELTELRFYSEDDYDDESDEEEESKAPRQRATKKAASKPAKAANSRSKRTAKKAASGDASERAAAPTRSRRSRKKEADAGGNGAAEPDAGGTAEGAGQGEGAANDGNANPLDDPAISAMIGKVDLP